MINKITRVFDCIEYQKNNYPQDKSLVYKEKNNWKSYSSQDFITISNNVSRSLLKLGLRQLKQKRSVRIFYQQHFHRVQVFLRLPKNNPMLSLQKS